MEEQPKRYRPRTVLKLALAAAGVFWAVCFLGFFRAPELVSPWTHWGCLGLSAFFFVTWLYFARLRIDVDQGGIRYRGLRSTMNVAFADVLKVSVVPTLLMQRVYLVITRKGVLLFSSHFKGHRELCALLLERAGLRA